MENKGRKFCWRKSIPPPLPLSSSPFLSRLLLIIFLFLFHKFVSFFFFLFLRGRGEDEEKENSGGKNITASDLLHYITIRVDAAENRVRLAFHHEALSDVLLLAKVAFIRN